MSQRYIGGVVTETTNVAQSPWTGEWTQQAALQGFAGAQAPLKVANSLRFRSSASAYLNRTPSVAGNRKTWTWSGWVKRGVLSAQQALFGASNGGASSGDWVQIVFDGSTNAIDFIYYASGVVGRKITTAVYRDPSSWYHILAVFNTTSATGEDRMQLWVNGVRVTSFSTNTILAQNTNGTVNNTQIHEIGALYYTPNTNFFDGYLTEINFIDGQALPPTAFGTINKENGVWSPITYTGTYGTNGFRLNFSNGTSTTTLGYDSSGNGNNWTTNNISLTAGSTYDWMIDSPTKFPGSSYGVGNYAVLNPLDNGGLTIASANLNSSDSGGSWKSIRSTIGISSGKWYWEVTAASGTNLDCGISKSTAAQSTNNYVGADANGWGYVGSNGQKYTAGSGSAYGATYTSGDVVGIAFDADAGTLTFYKNNVSQGTAFTGLTSGPYFPAVSNYSSGWAINFGQRPFAYTPPSGYKSLCTQNLPGVTIQNGAAYMAATTYTGSGGSMAVSNAVNGVGFQPDYVWIKSRSNPRDHRNMDSVRGINNVLSSNLTNAEYAGSALSALIATGFTLNTSDQQNNSGETYIAWQWKANGTAVTNTAGSITSSVSANTTAGFSVVTYTNPASGPYTVGHGLNVAPSMILFKDRTNGAYSWVVYHSAIGNTGAMFLNATAAVSTSSAFFNNTSPTSSVFTVAVNGVGVSGDPIVAYCFAAISGYSAFGSYTGNGSADGPFVYCGFRPRYVLIKRTNDVSNWTLRDTSRDPYNVTTLDLYPNLSNAQTSGPNIDILSNGFKCRDAGGQATNASGSTYIYAAFAENPFQNALAR